MTKSPKLKFSCQTVFVSNSYESKIYMTKSPSNFVFLTRIMCKRKRKYIFFSWYSACVTVSFISTEQQKQLLKSLGCCFTYRNMTDESYLVSIIECYLDKHKNETVSGQTFAQKNQIAIGQPKTLQKMREIERTIFNFFSFASCYCPIDLCALLC